MAGSLDACSSTDEEQTDAERPLQTEREIFLKSGATSEVV